MGKNLLFNPKLQKIFEILLTIFALYIIVQILMKIFGGSLSTEDIFLALLILNVGATFTIGIMVAQMKADHQHLKDQFASLAQDFKQHLKRE